MSVFYITGPTASGKSALALELAARLDGEIVNTDAFQVYRGLEVLTAAPTIDERARMRHHLFGIIDASEDFNAACYAALAGEALAEIASRGRAALVVGGSGLYVKALTHGLDDLPSDAALRAQLLELSLDEKVARLQNLDPVGAAEMNLGNPRHVERALEICLLSGRPASELKRRWRGRDASGLRGILLDWPRDVLIERIERRVADMFDRGAVKEVARIEETCGFSITAARAIGVREIRALLTGTITRDEAVASVSLATRRYAKRQMTWFRSERWLKTICLDSGTTPESVADRVAGEWKHA